MIALDHADMAAHIAGEPGVGCRVNILRADAIARLELRVGRCGAPEFAAHHHAFDVIEGELTALEGFGGCTA